MSFYYVTVFFFSISTILYAVILQFKSYNKLSLECALNKHRQHKNEEYMLNTMNVYDIIMFYFLPAFFR